MAHKRRSGYSNSVRKPMQANYERRRLILALVLCVLVPPLGILLLWRLLLFNTPTRIGVTLVSALLLMIVVVLLMPASTPVIVTPTVRSPDRAEAAPASEVRTALSNMDQLLYEQQLQEVVERGGTEDSLLSDSEQLAIAAQQQEEVLNTVVYCVNRKAKLYHLEPVCGNQSNGRALTVREAMAEGLGACPDCNPPVYGFATVTGGVVNSD